jgi:L-aspartate oxidase
MSASNDDRPVVVIGAGIAGLSVALDLAPRSVIVLSPSLLGEGIATAWAQGGVAAAIGSDDSPALHAADTLAAAAGIGDRAVAARIAEAAPGCIERLIARGVAFDRNPDGTLALGLEAAHSRRRIVHAGGDSTGAAIIAALIRTARATPSIAIDEGASATEIAVEDGVVTGVCVELNGEPSFLPASIVILATGGIGGLYAHTTNPLGATGAGIALAARAGAVLRDVEFVQFHPTAIAVGRDPMPLASEAVRGEGAILINDHGQRFMSTIQGAELAPRDVVARAIAREAAAGRSVFLDSRAALGTRFEARFPSVAASCRNAGLDPAKEPIPVRPAAHYHMGGVAVDQRGRTSVAGLWACGEVAATGLHGGNRLASNSLLEGLAFARWIADDVAGFAVAARRTSAPKPAARSSLAVSNSRIAELRRLMTETVGVVRDSNGLGRAISLLAPLAFKPASPASLADRALVGLLIATAAWRRTESRGGHFRSDHPVPSQEWTHSSTITVEEAREIAERVTAENATASDRLVAEIG